MYGPKGLLQRRQDFDSQMAAGAKALESGQYADAQRHYESCLEIIESTKHFRSIHDRAGNEDTPFLGIGDALVGQRKFSEAKKFYDKALAIRTQWFEMGHPAIIDIHNRLKKLKIISERLSGE